MRILVLKEYVIIFLGLFLLIPLIGYGASINLGEDRGSPGDTVTIPVTLNYIEGERPNICSIGVDIGFDPNILENPQIEIGSAGSAADKDVVSNLVSPGLLRIGILGYNKNIISAGIVAKVTFTIKADAADGNYTLTNHPSASDPDGNAISVTGAELSTYEVVAQSVVYPEISTEVGNVVDPENISTPIGNAFNEIFPDTSVTVIPDKRSGILSVNIAGTEFPVVVTSTGTTSNLPDNSTFEVMNGGLTARVVFTDGRSIEIAPMAADPEGVKEAFTNAGLTTEFKPDKGMIIVTDRSYNKYAGIFGWSAGPIGNKTIDTFTMVDGSVQILYTDGSSQSVAPAVGSLQSFVDLLEESGLQYTIDRSTGVINLANGSSCWKPDYVVRPFSDISLTIPGTEWIEYINNRNHHGLYFKDVGDVNGDGLVDIEIWSGIGKQFMWQVLCE